MKVEIGLWGKMVYTVSSFLILALARLLFRLKIVGIENIPRKGAVIIAPNHISYFDPSLVFVSLGIPQRIHCMANKKLFRYWFLRWFMETVGTIPVNQRYSRKSLADVLRMLHHGHCVIIFPEGKRSKDGRLIQGRPGAVHAAIRADSVIVPAAVVGSDKVLPYDAKFIKSLSQIEIHLGKPYRIYYPGNKNKIPSTILTEETSILMKKIEELLPENMRSTSEQKQEWYGLRAH